MNQELLSILWVKLSDLPKVTYVYKVVELQLKCEIGREWLQILGVLSYSNFSLRSFLFLQSFLFSFLPFFSSHSCLKGNSLPRFHNQVRESLKKEHKSGKIAFSLTNKQRNAN